MFMKALPTMLPSARSKCPFLTASTLVASSGMLVPNATIVAPITSSFIPMDLAILVAESTMKYELATVPKSSQNCQENVFMEFAFFAA